MKIKKIAASILLSLSILSAFAASGGNAVPDWIFKGFDQAIIPVSFIVNDILYAGFSPNKVNPNFFSPIKTHLSPIERMGKDDNGAYFSNIFFIYAIASTKNAIDLQLEFANLENTGMYFDADQTIGNRNYKADGGSTEPSGWMYTNSTETDPNIVKQRIKVWLEGVQSLPYVLPVIPSGLTSVKNIVVSNPPNVTLRLRVDKSEIDAKTEGTYHTVLKLTALIK